MFWTEPPAAVVGTVTLIVTVPVSPTAISAFTHDTLLPVLVQVNCDELTPVTVTAAGTTSPTTTPNAGSGPLLVMFRIHWKPPPAPTCSPLAVFRSEEHT